MRQSFTTSLSYLTVLATAGCMAGPAFLKQSGQAAIPTENVSTVEAGSVTSAALQPSKTKIQVVTASSSGAVAGTSVTFPPGSIALATSVSIGPGEQLANDAVTNQLNLGTQVSSAGQPVEVASSTSEDTTEPFTIALSLPSSSSLALDGTDPYANLIVLFHVKHAGAGGADFTGAFTRSQFQIVNNQVIVSTEYFGTYQAVYMQAPVTQVVQAVQAAPAAVGTDTQIAHNIYFVSGAASGSFGTGLTSSGGLQAWVPRMSSYSVAAGATLSNTIISTVVYGD